MRLMSRRRRRRHKSFEIEMSYEELQLQTLQFCVMGFDRYSRQKVIGDVLLPLAELAQEGVDITKELVIWRDIQTSQPVLNRICKSFYDSFLKKKIIKRGIVSARLCCAFKLGSAGSFPEQRLLIEPGSGVVKEIVGSGVVKEIWTQITKFPDEKFQYSWKEKPINQFSRGNRNFHIKFGLNKLTPSTKFLPSGSSSSTGLWIDRSIRASRSRLFIFL